LTVVLVLDWGWWQAYRSDGLPLAVVFADMLRVPRGTIRATVLIETITAAFEMEEIIYELRQHSSGLNCGRWDYIFSFIKKFRNHPDKVLPNRCELGVWKFGATLCSGVWSVSSCRLTAHMSAHVLAELPLCINYCLICDAVRVTCCACNSCL
jgi:hypothetical protein